MNTNLGLIEFCFLVIAHLPIALGLIVMAAGICGFFLARSIKVLWGILFLDALVIGLASMGISFHDDNTDGEAIILLTICNLALPFLLVNLGDKSLRKAFLAAYMGVGVLIMPVHLLW